MNAPQFKPVADHAVLVEFASEISDDVNRLVIALDHAITMAQIKGLQEVVPALVNLLVVFDPLETDHVQVEKDVRSLLPVSPDSDAQATHHTLDICYDDDFSPDLVAVAKACGMSEDAVIQAHSSARYRVGMYGFAPGYAYLAGVPEAIQVPRKTAPVRDIPAGSVMIAGPQCLATTIVMPTGWSIIGRTPAKIMTGNPDRPFLFDVGDTVSFNRIRREAL
ncbi:sensor histidine kinase inhibitor, KipI family [Litoreibacter ascidiaceicola]|uniref:Sensor histidine kinase inhibitor, KipI family n=1 Tax=Litoreibacter ascidiaceicola TaxID=1486859 RepID=A0A1M4ZXB2_9RHOB|nr:5-oxoprolinase subunit PxpB [Litoreibacter ascidiaceicola]SHF22690.1 sensor histidine kinase inhibitor, KipI family [Litoreibacter ascidiaceicola]